MANIDSNEYFRQQMAIAMQPVKSADEFAPLKGDSDIYAIHMDQSISVKNRKPGASVDFFVSRALSDPGFHGDAILKDQTKEEGSYGYDRVAMDILKKDTQVGNFEDLQTQLNLLSDASKRVALWFKEEYYKTLPMTKLRGGTYQAYDATPALSTYGEAGSTNTNLFYPDGCVSVSAIQAENGVTVKMLRRLARYLLNATYGHIISKVPVKGKSGYYWPLLLSLNAAGHLQADPEYQQMMREADKRGKDNPVFTGEMPAVHGILPIAWDAVSTTTVGGVSIARNMLLGRQSMIWAEASEMLTGAEGLGYNGIDPEGVYGAIYGNCDKCQWDDTAVDNGDVMVYSSNEEP